MGQRKHGFGPLADARSRTLILGSLPGEESLRIGQYYANAGNQFWTIIEGVYGEPAGATYAERIAFLRGKALALWDVLRSAERDGSSDRRIRAPDANDIEGFLRAHSSITVVVLAGTCCQREWRKLRVNTGGVAVRHAPSTSRAPGRYVPSLEQKIAVWRKVLLGH
ncbi:MAG: DNA-deoxyinosine glycosylase [Phycisphaerales bacterium]|nr:DNA-deoxyinosine glycosylase [Phycisphaerales bacterium]